MEAIAPIAAHRAGGNGSLRGRRNADTSTFCLVWSKTITNKKSFTQKKAYYITHRGVEVAGYSAETDGGVGPDSRLETWE